jgi:hypothetical protein
MHVAPDGLKTVRQDGITVGFAMLGPMAYVLAEVPRTGSSGTSLERPCDRAHWGFVIDGEMTFVSGRRRQVIPSGRAFHVPAGGPMHRFETAGRLVLAAFQPVEAELDVSDARLIEQGFEVLPAASRPTVVPAVSADLAGPGEIKVETWRMSSYVMTRVRMGERTGYTSGWCDAPHWGLVTRGRLAIEWEHDVEILSKGDIFHCPAGPPGHRIEAADPATFLDLTPVAAFEAEARFADWRRGTLPATGARTRGIAVAALG